MLSGFFGGKSSSSTAAPAPNNAAAKQSDNKTEKKNTAPTMTEIVETNVYVPIDPDVRAYQSTTDLDNRLAERSFDSRRTWDHVTLDDVAREMDDLKMDKDVDEQILSDIQKGFEILTKATVMPADSKRKEKKALNPSRISEIENRLDNDPSLRLDQDDPAANSDEPEALCAPEVKKKLVRSYARLKKQAYDLQPITTHQIEHRIQVLRSDK